MDSAIEPSLEKVLKKENISNSTAESSTFDAARTNDSNTILSKSSKNGCESCDCEKSLAEEEASAAIREISFAVQSICISEMLPRTSELLFINLTTLESHCYCIELTKKGWRIASARQDCMNGDFRQLDVHTRYFETIYQLLDSISPEYRHKFGAKLISQLNDLKLKYDSKTER